MCCCWGQCYGDKQACVGQCREVVNQVLEKARGERFLGSALEAKVLLHVADTELAQSLQALQGVRASPAMMGCTQCASACLPAKNHLALLLQQ